MKNMNFDTIVAALARVPEIYSDRYYAFCQRLLAALDSDEQMAAVFFFNTFFGESSWLEPANRIYNSLRIIEKVESYNGLESE